jgi:periplasmic divalent cation tolerance protein
MSHPVQVQVNFSTLEEAKRIVRLLLEKKLIACANLVPWIESYYIWEEKIQMAQETKVFLKTDRANFDEIEKIILENCANEVPEILIFEIQGGHTPYLKWLETEVVLHSAID